MLALTLVSSSYTLIEPISRQHLGEEVVGVNPKVNNLMKPYKSAKYDILWVLDSNVLADPGTLGRAVDSLLSQKPGKASVGLVHHVPLAFVCEKSFGSRVEEAFLNTNHAKMYIALNMLAIDSCVTGKSSMYRRSDIERVNADLKAKPLAAYPGEAAIGSRPGYGWPAFGRFMAEDNMIGMAIWHELGMRHDLSCDVAENAISKMTFMDYVHRRVRWIRVRKKMVLAATVLEPLTECVVVALLTAWAVNRHFGLPMWIFILAHMSVWLTVDLDIYASLKGKPVGRREQWPFICAWITRELCALPIWAMALVGDRVIWRGREYKIFGNGEATVVERPDQRRHNGYQSVPQGEP